MVAAHAAVHRARRARRAAPLGLPLSPLRSRRARLRTLRELLDEHDIGLGDVGFALRLRREPELRRAVEGWLEAQATRPAEVAPGDWLRFEQDKHQKLLAAAALT